MRKDASQEATVRALRTGDFLEQAERREHGHVSESRIREVKLICCSVQHKAFSVDR